MGREVEGTRGLITADLTRAMKQKDTLRTSTLRMILTQISHKQKEKGQEVDEGQIVKLLYTMLKQRREAAEQYERAGRSDLAEKERAEMGIIEGYLPAQLDTEEIRAEARRAIEELGASSMRDMGKVMGFLTKKLAGQASGSAISEVVKEELSGAG
ncbi:MAG: GatB/YqeY domain-containing protein [Nitrospinota bacterium]